MNRFCSVDETSRVGEVRRAAMALARQEDLDEKAAGNLAVVVTEVCTNLLKHAGSGQVYLSVLSERGGRGVEILAVDRGPGMPDVARCLADGYSSAHTAGTGLGAILRLSQAFDIYSVPGQGTVLMAQVGEQPVSGIGAVVKPIAGEEFSGDAWSCAEYAGLLSILVADGLGHGVLASKASSEAVSSFRRAETTAPDLLVQGAHLALRGTRGAAVAAALLNRAERTVQFCGIGNIAGVVVADPKPQFMVSHPGTAGFGSPKIQVFSYPVPDGGLLVMHSDGLTTSWKLDAYPGLRQRHPSLIAGVLFRDASRERDDTCVVVARLKTEL